jgi:hypothetical protein
LLLDKNDECIGYLPGFAAKREFTGPNPETAVTKYVVNVFEDDSNSATLREIGGAGKFDTISDEAKVSDVLAKMAGGFRLLVVLKNNYHRRPVGVVNFNDFMIGAVKDSAGLEASPAALTIGAFR